MTKQNKKKSKSKSQKAKKPKSKESVKKKNKIQNPKSQTFHIIIIVCVSILILVLAAYFYIDSLRSYSYGDVEFTTVQEGDLTFYQTSIPVIVNKENIVPYNFYLRTKPRELAKMPFDSEDFSFMKNTVMSFEKDFNCDGDAIIAIANLAKLHEILGISIMRDENVSCDSRYSYIKIMEGEKTEVQKLDKNCYNLVLADCEILKVTERYMLEMFAEYNL